MSHEQLTEVVLREASRFDYEIGRRRLTRILRGKGHKFDCHRLRAIMLENGIEGRPGPHESRRDWKRVEEIRRLYGMGWTQQKIADRLQTTQQAICRTMQELGIARRPRQWGKKIIRARRTCLTCETWFTPRYEKQHRCSRRCVGLSRAAEWEYQRNLKEAIRRADGVASHRHSGGDTDA